VSTLTEFHVQRLAALRTDRLNFDNQWEEAAAYLIPAHRDSFLSRNMNYGAGGEKKTELQYDSTAAFAAMRFASVMESLATPQSSIWHMLKPVDKMLMRNRSVRVFFEDLSDILFSYRYRPVANFVGNSQQVYHGLGVYGNGILFIDKPDDLRGLRYRNIHLGEAYYVENHAGVVDTLYRPFSLTASQIVQQYGDKAPEVVREANKNPMQKDKKYEVLICVYPRRDYDTTRRDAGGMPWASLHIFCETKELMRESGYASFPFAVARHMQISGEVYGRGPAQMVLPAIKTLNQEKYTVLKQGHRVVDPVLLLHDDGVLDGLSMKAGALNKGGVSAEGRLLVQPLPTGNIAVGDKLMELERNVINDAFLVTLFQILVDSPQMTATEVLERAREKGMLLAPTAGRLQSEFLGPMIEREIDVLARQGLLPQMPPILRDAAAEYRIEYDSPMSRMMRAEKAAGFMRVLGSLSEYAKITGDLEPLDHMNFDAATPDMLDINGAPVAWTRSEEEIAARREARNQAAQAQQMVDAAPAAASLMKTVQQ
jgi:hypothetical protein